MNVKSTDSMLNKEELSYYYLKKHRIVDLFNDLTAALVYHHPDDPKKFMIDYFEKMKSARSSKVNYPCLFDESNLRSLFRIMDPAEKGYISYMQYKSGMDNLGVTNYNHNPVGSETGRIGIDVFVNEATKGFAMSPVNSVGSTINA
ncbi:EF-hand calcium-binding domain-containing protein 10 isoform X2 [Hydra vulgaris]|uniref:EF-hand calcium-binding domain-containing protein 10 isoform X2 n=1 Tax=Hydra vulgaris TaxID=6087 RepID=A0ABM4D2W8_HYDVU